MRLAAASLCALLGCAARAPRTATPHPAAPRGWRYTVAGDPDLATLRATVCFDGAAPARLVAHDSDAYQHLRVAVVADSARELAVSPDGIALDGVAPDACVRYVVVRPGPVASTNRWLWFPEHPDPDAVVTARFVASVDFFVSVPWAPLPDGAYSLDATAFSREGFVGFSRRPLVALPVEGATLTVAGIDTARAERDAYQGWLRDSARLVAGLYGTFPVTAAQILLVGRGAGRDPVRFGLTSSASGASVLFFVDRDATADALRPDSTAAHEFVHLGQPVMPDADAWLAEGLAVYYEHVLRARAGVITPAAAWTVLHQGFARGRADRTGRPLADDAAALRRDDHFSRVYWTGAAFALLADVALRERSSNARSLDDAVRAVHACCGDRARVFAGAEVLARMDALADRPVVSELARAIAGTEFPSLDALYERLGLRVVGDRVELAPAPDAALRDAIMAPR